MKNLFYSITLLITFTTIISCQKTTIKPEDPHLEITNQKNLIVEYQELFAKALSEAIKDEEVRSFIKKEALKMVNKDYEVFYPFVKNTIVGQNETFREKILKCLDDTTTLSDIENTLPLLTILVPELPSGFSAHNWETSIEVPIITSSYSQNNKMTYYGHKMGPISIDNNLIPGVPTLVIKKNERIITKNVKFSNTSRSNDKISNSNNIEYKFAAPEFDGINNKLKSSIQTMSSRPEIIGPRVGKEGSMGNIAVANLNNVANIISSFNEMGTDEEYWQRDHFYYGLTRSNTKGKFKSTYQEHIKQVMITEKGLQKMMDQDDPHYRNTLITGTEPMWTDGHFELQFSFLINSTNGLGNIDKIVPAAPTDLFDLQYTLVNTFPIPTYKITKIFPKPYDVSIPIAAWDLESLSYAWRVRVYENDGTRTITESYKNSSEFATNFGFDINLGENVKFGLKFGGSTKQIREQTYTIATTEGADFLGDFAIYFSDPIATRINTGRGGSVTSIKGTVIGTSDEYVNFVIVPQQRLN